VVLGEVGGVEEYDICQMIKNGELTKVGDARVYVCMCV
jgi:hypothetical protein